MKTYEIEQTETAVILWTGKAESEKAALDSMAREAGYRDYAHACEDTSSDGVEVREMECNGHPAGPYDRMGEPVYCDGSCR